MIIIIIIINKNKLCPIFPAHLSSPLVEIKLGCNYSRRLLAAYLWQNSAAFASSP